MKTGAELKEIGIQQALDFADEKVPKWSETAYNFALGYISKVPVFMVEEMRQEAEGFVPDPPSKRAWGGIVRKLKNKKLIEHNGYRQVKNPLAHMANATLWKVL